MFSNQHIAKISVTETRIESNFTSVCYCNYVYIMHVSVDNLRVCIDYVMNLNSFTQINNTNAHCHFK